MALTVSMKLTGDAKGAVAAAQAADKALADLRQAAHQAAATARETAMGFGDVEERTRSASAAASLYGGQFRAMSAAIDEAEAHTARLNDEREREAALLAQTRAAINPYVAAQQQYAARQNEITAALKAGAVSEMEAARARDLARTAYARHLTTLRQATAATREHTGAVRLQGYQVANLFQQFQDVGTQLAMGTNPFIILAQQGPQITSAMGGVKNALQVVRPFFTAATISAGALTAGSSPAPPPGTPILPPSRRCRPPHKDAGGRWGSVLAISRRSPPPAPRQATSRAGRPGRRNAPF